MSLSPAILKNFLFVIKNTLVKLDKLVNLYIKKENYKCEVIEINLFHYQQL